MGPRGAAASGSTERPSHQPRARRADRSGRNSVVPDERPFTVDAWGTPQPGAVPKHHQRRASPQGSDNSGASCQALEYREGVAVSKVQKWGREESLIWPPRGFYYTYGAIFLAIVAAAFLTYVRFSFGLTLLQQYYLPHYLRTSIAGILHQSSTYQLVYVFDEHKGTRFAIDSDLQPGSTLQSLGKALPFQLSSAAYRNGVRLLWREPRHIYQNGALHEYLTRWIYGGATLWDLFEIPVLFGGLALVLQLPFSIRKDI